MVDKSVISITHYHTYYNSIYNIQGRALFLHGHDVLLYINFSPSNFKDINVFMLMRPRSTNILICFDDVALITAKSLELEKSHIHPPVNARHLQTGMVI